MNFDYKQVHQNLYLPKAKPALVDVPLMRFIMIHGKENPGGKAYRGAITGLSALSYTIK